MLNGAFSERSTIMRTNSAEGSEAASYIGDTDRHGTKQELARSPFWRKFRFGRNANKLRHMCNIPRDAQYNLTMYGVMA